MRWLKAENPELIMGNDLLELNVRSKWRDFSRKDAGQKNQRGGKEI